MKHSDPHKISPSAPVDRDGGLLAACASDFEDLTLGDAAVLLADAGLPVFPLVPGGKTPLTQRGHLDASTDRVRVSRWWSRWPGANIGMPTGAPSFDVLDVDVRPEGSGIQAVERLRTRGVIPPPAVVIRTPSGGLHLYYKGSPQRSSRIPNQHLDLKADGGYVVVPPSAAQTPPGPRATYRVESVAERLQPLDWPAIRTALTPPSRITTTEVSGRGGRGRSAGALEGHVLGLTAGDRNNGLHWALCRALESGLDVQPLLRAGRHIRLSDDEVRRTHESALRTVRGDLR